MSRTTIKKATSKAKTNATNKASTKRARTSAKRVAKPAAMNNQSRAQATTPKANQPAPQPQGAQVIPFRQPGWDRQHPWLAKQSIHATPGFAPVAHRFNHGRGK